MLALGLGAGVVVGAVGARVPCHTYGGGGGQRWQLQVWLLRLLRYRRQPNDIGGGASHGGISLQFIGRDRVLHPVDELRDRHLESERQVTRP